MPDTLLDMPAKAARPRRPDVDGGTGKGRQPVQTRPDGARVLGRSAPCKGKSGLLAKRMPGTGNFRIPALRLPAAFMPGRQGHEPVCRGIQHHASARKALLEQQLPAFTVTQADLCATLHACGPPVQSSGEPGKVGRTPQAGQHKGHTLAGGPWQVVDGKKRRDDGLWQIENGSYDESGNAGSSMTYPAWQHDQQPGRQGQKTIAFPLAGQAG